jgi:hypothetical protein
MLALSNLETCREKVASMPAAVLPPCIFCARDLGMLALVFGLCRLVSLFWGVDKSFITVGRDLDFSKGVHGHDGGDLEPGRRVPVS